MFWLKRLGFVTTNTAEIFPDILFKHLLLSFFKWKRIRTKCLRLSLRLNVPRVLFHLSKSQSLPPSKFKNDIFRFLALIHRAGGVKHCCMRGVSECNNAPETVDSRWWWFGGWTELNALQSLSHSFWNCAGVSNSSDITETSSAAPCHIPLIPEEVIICLCVSPPTRRSEVRQSSSGAVRNLTSSLKLDTQQRSISWKYSNNKLFRNKQGFNILQTAMHEVSQSALTSRVFSSVTAGFINPNPTVLQIWQVSKLESSLSTFPRA